MHESSHLAVNEQYHQPCVLIGQKREITGTSSARKLRNEGAIPIAIYTKKAETLLFSIPQKELELAVSKKLLDSRILYIKVDGSEQILKSVIKCVHKHPVTGRIISLEMQKFSDGEKVKVPLNIKVMDHLLSPGIKKGGFPYLHLRTIDCYCNSSDIPSYVSLSVTGMEVGDVRYSSDIVLPSGITVSSLKNLRILTVYGKKG
ncbi:50S ribosomal protein L25 [Candidatus Fokinia crypta]|uniref:Large ribosomal subunit protein bL25 n=1 Tax=Candidatus Fokinia crypta TaxID=1920990 RepID=A0ABZ0URN7_9RICK|nr:50S ribosomal protein L25 [Candidatus Fokinia cryptica]WPX97921.1 50S ribosomal protein L25 [Candidatus Fokinia cryptica]